MKNANPEAAKNLRELFITELRDIYWAENALLKAIPDSMENCTSEDLKEALENHLEVTHEQVERLNQVFDILGIERKGKKCEAMEGLIHEAEEIISDTNEGPIRDAGIISAMQKVEHYEIASYGTLCSFANFMGEDEIVSLLEQTLSEEKEADALLTDLAENKININSDY